MQMQIFNMLSTNPGNPIQGQAIWHGKEQVGEYLLEFKVEHRALSRTASGYNIDSKLTVVIPTDPRGIMFVSIIFKGHWF
jgi:hypothetical protein